MDKEMIEKLKNNLAKFRCLPAEDQDFLKSLPPESVQFLTEWGGWLATGSFGTLMPVGIYRIAPDYQPEPEVVECEVFTREGRLYYSSCPDDSGWTIECALNNPDFIGYKYGDGDVRCSPRRSNDPDRPAEIPTHVLFRRSK